MYTKAIATHTHCILASHPLKIALPLNCYFHFAFEDITTILVALSLNAILLRQLPLISQAHEGRGKEKGQDWLMRYGEQGAQEKKRGGRHVLAYVITAQHHLTVRPLKQERQKLCPKEMKANMLTGQPEVVINITSPSVAVHSSDATGNYRSFLPSPHYSALTDGGNAWQCYHT